MKVYHKQNLKVKTKYSSQSLSLSKPETHSAMSGPKGYPLVPFRNQTHQHTFK